MSRLAVFPLLKPLMPPPSLLHPYLAMDALDLLVLSTWGCAINGLLCASSEACAARRADLHHVLQPVHCCWVPPRVQPHCRHHRFVGLVTGGSGYSHKPLSITVPCLLMCRTGETVEYCDLPLDHRTLPLIKFLPGEELLLTAADRTGVFLHLDGSRLPKDSLHWSHRPDAIGRYQGAMPLPNPPPSATALCPVAVVWGSGRHGRVLPTGHAASWSVLCVLTTYFVLSLSPPPPSPFHTNNPHAWFGFGFGQRTASRTSCPFVGGQIRWRFTTVSPGLLCNPSACQPRGVAPVTSSTAAWATSTPRRDAIRWVPPSVLVAVLCCLLTPVRISEAHMPASLVHINHRCLWPSSVPLEW